MNELAVLKNLRTLDLSATNVTGAGMRDLAVLKKLTTLYFCGPGSHAIVPPAEARQPSLTDAGAKGLAALESLINLDLSLNNVTPAVLRELAALKNLTALDLSATSTTGAEIKEVTALQNLRILSLFDCIDLADDGVKQLATLNNLAYIDIIMTKISDAGLMELSAIPGLAHLRVYSPNLSESGEKAFKQKNPKCELSGPTWRGAIKSQRFSS
jgi:internalin A